MAGTMELSNLLDNDYFSLSTTVKEKIESHLTSLKDDIEGLKSKNEKLRVNSEQQYFEIEKQLINSNTKLESESYSNEQLKQQVAELEKSYNEASTELKTLQDSQEGSSSTQLRLTKVNEQLELEKRELAMLVEKRNKEIDTLNDELKRTSKKLSEMNTAKCEALAKLGEINSNEVNKEYQIKRLDQEKDSLQKQIDWLNADLNEKTKELMTVRREKSSKVLEVQSKLEEKTEEASLLQSTLESLRKTNTDQAVKIDNFIQRIKDIQDSNSQAEEQYRQEIQARVRLVDLYKNASEEAENKSTELTGAVTELQKLLQEAAQAHTDMEDEKDRDMDKLRQEIDARESRIDSLEQELVNANDLLSLLKSKNVSEDKVDQMFPTAAATSHMLKSGMTLTQIYNEYVQATDNLQLEKEENKRLNTYLDQILNEIEEKAPILIKQREDYDEALKSIDQMTRQLDAAMLESQTLRSETDESHRKSSHLTRENSKQQQQIHDLSSQVKFLVKEVEELQGGRVVREDISSPEVSSSSRLISDKLVTFRNIEELQEQNQKLLAVIRELSEKQEQEENSAIDSRTRELRDQLDMAQEELSALKDARSRQAEMVESIVRQRDMYRVLLQQTGSEPAPVSSSTFNMSGAKSPGTSLLKSPEPKGKKLDETNLALKQLQTDFASYRKEKLENEKMQNDQVDKMRQSTSDLRVQNAKLSSQLDYSTERHKVLQTNAEGYKKEISTLRDKIQKYSTSVAKHEQTINSLREDCTSNKEMLAQSQTRVENLRAEKEMIRSSEHRLSIELDSIRRERQSQTMLMANLQAIQNNLERNEYETKHRLGKQVETCERDKLALRRRLETEEKTHATAIKHWQHQVNELRGQIEQEIKNHQKSKDLHTTANKQVQELKAEILSTTSQLTSTQTRLSNLSSEESGLERSNEEVRDLRSELESSRAEIVSLQGHLQKARQHVDQYKTIADGVQQTIKEQNEASEDFKESLEERLREAVEARNHLEETLDKMETERQELLNENIRITEESHNLNAELRKNLTSLQNEHQELIERRETAIAMEMSAKQDSDSQQRLAGEAQDKYERELMLHASDVEALSAVKKQMETFNARLAEKEEQASIAEKTLEESQSSWRLREELLVSEKEKLSSRVTDLVAQTRALHEQMSKLSSQVVSVQERAVATSRMKLVGAPADDATKSSDQLLEVIRYLRKEKDIAEGRLDVVETECSRLKQRCDSQDKQLESTNTELANERQKVQSDMQTAAQHADLMHKVEQYNLLHDSNKLLREEKDQLLTQFTQAEAKLSKLEETICPLQKEIRELQAQKEGLEVDRTSTMAELDRWKNRTSTLIEQSHKTDPEEHKRLVQEKEEMRKQVTSLTEDLHKSRTEMTKQSMETAKSQRQAMMNKEEVARLNGEMKTVKDDLDVASKEAAEKVKTINQLKKIGRKYKEQAESVTKEFEDYKSEHKGDEAQKQNVQQANNEQIKVLESKIQDLESANSSLESKMTEIESKRADLDKTITEANQQKAVLEQSLKESESKKSGLEQQVTILRSEKEQMKAEKEQISQQGQNNDAKTNKLTADLTATRQEIIKIKEEKEKMKEEKMEFEKKLTRANLVLSTAKNKLQSMKEINEKLTSERLEMKKKISTAAEQSDLSQESENEISELRLELDAKNSLITELQNKVSDLERQILASQPQVQASRSVGAVPSDRISASPAEAPKTANIRPIASSSPAGIKPQTVPIQPQSAASKVTASIRPMAIAPTTISPLTTTSGTPTATVMPTTVSQQDLIEVTEEITPVQQLFPPQQSTSSTGRPTQQVQRVIPTQESGLEVVHESSQAETGIVEPQPSSSRETAVIQQSSKRPREDTESPGEDSSVKRSKKAVSTTEEIPEIIVTDESARTTQVPPLTTQTDDVTDDVIIEDEEEPTQEEETEDVEQEEEMEEPEDYEEEEEEEEDEEEEEEEIEEEQEEDDEPVVILSTDDDEAEVDESGDGGDQHEDQNEDYPQEDIEEEYRDEDHTDGQEEDDIYAGIGEIEESGFTDDVTQGEVTDDVQQQTQQDDDDDIVIIEDDNDGPADTQGSEPQSLSQSSSQGNQQTLLPPLHPLMSTERQQSVPGRNMLTPFMIGGHPGFDEDDCTVPSTPTLNVPRRGDGFAEAVSSPMISQRFVFGSGGEQNLTLSGLAQLDQQAILGMGMDDTRMDLSQLEDGSGRSVPSTPLHTTAPVTAISEMGALTSQSEPSLVYEGQEGEESEEVQVDVEEGQEGDDDFEGELGEEDSQDGDDKSQHQTELIDDETEAGTSQEDMTSSQAADRSAQDAGRPRIQKIVWDSPVAQVTTAPVPVPSQMSGQAIQSIGTITSSPPYRRGSPATRGVPQARGSRGAGFQRGQSARRPMRSRGGGMYQRRPPMY